MSLKQEIETWVTALGQYDNQEFEEALRTFDTISDTAKILFNCGVIHATLGQHENAVECFARAIKRDNYLAVAYFQQGVSNFLAGDFEEALANFNDTLLYLRGNRDINYEQLGLKFKLYACEVLFNRGLCYIYLQQKEIGMGDLRYAAREKVTDDHDVIDEAIQEGAEGFTVFSIGVGIIYRPNAAKVRNLKSKDYLGKARLIATSEQSSYVPSSDAKQSALAAAAERSRDDRPPESISFAASYLVKPGLHSRSRQQSEPPINRNVFPPTPPPEHENIRPPILPASTSPPANPPSMSSIRDQQQKPLPTQPLRPEPLKLSSSSFTSLQAPKEKPRIGTTRTASEPRGPSHRDPQRALQPHRLFGETTPLRPLSNGAEADIDEEASFAAAPSHPATSSTHSLPTTTLASPPRARRRHSASRSHRTHYSIEEEDETAAATTPNTSSSPTTSLSDFEILNNAGGLLSRPPAPSQSQSQASFPQYTHHHTRAASQSTRPRARSSSRHTHRASSSRPSRKPTAGELQSLRVKAHLGDETRYVMIPPKPGAEGFAGFVERIKEKFGIQGGFKVKMRDEEDLITMGDWEDWDMALGAVRRELGGNGNGSGNGNKGGEEGMGRLEVWVLEVGV